MPVLDGVRFIRGNPIYALSTTGTLAYATGTAVRQQQELAWISSDGAVQSIAEAPRVGEVATPRLSPDGRLVLFRLGALGQGTLWVHDLERGVATQLADNDIRLAEWGPRGEWIYFSGGGEEGHDLFRRRADASAPAELLLARQANQYIRSISSDESALIFAELGAGQGYDLWLLPLEGDLTPEPIEVTPAREDSGKFSPDGRWIAFVSDASGTMEVYVRPHPGPGARTQISNNGGGEPMWARDGNRLFYRSRDGLTAVDVTVDGAFYASSPTVLTPLPTLPLHPGSYDPAPGGERFLISRPAGGQTAALERQSLNVVMNWLDEIDRLTPDDR